MTRNTWLITTTALILAHHPTEASAAEPTVTATTNVQLYSVPNPYGTRESRRRRYTQTLGLSLPELLPPAAGGRPEVAFSGRLRLDSDLGLPQALGDPGARDRYVPGIEPMPVDLQYAFFDVRDLGGDAVSLRIGRQLLADPLGWWSFDGALARLSTPTTLELAAYAGFEQRSLIPLLATSRYTADGVFRGSREALDANQWPSYLDQRRPAPAFGVALSTHALPWMDAELAYRRVTERDAVYLTLYPERGDGYEVIAQQRVSTERAAAALSLHDDRHGAVDGRVIYDLMRGVVSEHAATVSWFSHERATLSLGYDYVLPTFDGDSIFNWFSTSGMTTVELGADLVASRRTTVAPKVGVRTFAAPQAPLHPAAETGESTDRATADGFAHLSFAHRQPRARLHVDTGGDAGPDGHRVGADVQLERSFRDGLYDTLFLVSLHDWHDVWQRARDATSLTYVIGGGLHPSPGSRFGLEWEHTANRLVGQRFRILAMLSLEVGR